MVGSSVDKTIVQRTVLPRRRVAILLAVLAIVLAVLVMILVAAPSLFKPFIMDEMEFPAVAQAIANTGKPIYYRGDLLPNNVGLWHPPLYILWLAGWLTIFGDSVASSRSFGLANACMTIIAIGVFAIRRNQERMDQSQNIWIMPLALLVGLGIAATSPLLIQGSILPDIDTQVLPITITAFFLLLFELRHRGVREWVYWLAFVLMLILQLFAKLTTPILLIPSFMMFEFVRSFEISGGWSLRWRRRVSSQGRGSLRVLLTLGPQAYRSLTQPLIVLLASAVSIALMTMLWFVMASIWGVDFKIPFTYLTQSTNNPSSFGHNLGEIIAAIQAGIPGNFEYVAQWVGYPALGFLLLMIIRETILPAKGILNRSERITIYTFLIVLTAMYIVLRPAPFNFPKYYPPLIPLYSLLALDLLFAWRDERQLLFAIMLLGTQVALYLIYMSIRLPNVDFIYKVYTEWPKTPFFQAWMFRPLIAIFCISIVIWLFTRRRFDGILLTGVLAVMLGWQINISSVQARAPYSTTYYYGEDSLAQVAAYLRQTLPDKTVLIAPKDLGVLLQDRWHYIELSPDPRTYMERPEVHYLVFRTNDYYGNTLKDTPEIAAAVNGLYEHVTNVSNFSVMRRR